MIDTPLVSIPLICFNQERTIIEAIKSIQNQDYPNIEIIISDDCSTDKTIELIRSHLLQNSTNVPVFINVNKVNLGIGGNLALAITFCKGEFIVPASGDDISFRDRVSTVVSAWLKSNRKIGYINSDVREMTFEGQPIGDYTADDFNDYKSISDWLKKPQVFVGTECWSRDFYKSFPPPHNVSAEDQIMALRAIALKCGHTIHKPLLMHRAGGVTSKRPQTFEQKLNTLRREVLQSIEDYTQMQNDMNYIGLQRETGNFFRRKHAELRLLDFCISNHSVFQKFRSIVTAKHARVSQRLRCFSFVFLGPIHKFIYLVKRR